MSDIKDKRLKGLLVCASLAGSLLSSHAGVIPSSPAVMVPGAPVATASASLSAELAEARAMYEAANYKGVIDQLSAMQAALKTPLSPAAAREFVFLLGASCFHTADERALPLLTDYINAWPAGENVEEARLLRADFYFYAHDWSEALQQYNTIAATSLDADLREQLAYRKALCMIKCGFFSEARAELKNISTAGRYGIPVRYYKAYLDYVDGRDEEAMREFTEVSRLIGSMPGGYADSGIVPDYYLAQLYFRRSDWDRAASIASRLLEDNGYNEGGVSRRGITRRAANGGDCPDDTSELLLPTGRILGMSLYETHDLQRALPVLRRYVEDAGDNAMHDALYALGVCLYDANLTADAEECFSRVAEDRDAIGQGAALYLGQIAAGRNDVSVAAMNFERAYNMNYDNHLAETALYNYVAARTRGGNIPFDSNVKMLEEFIRNYPNSDYAPVIERHLATLYYNDGNYAEALRVIRKIRHLSKSDTLLLQSILYSGGSSALSAGKLSTALEYLRECVAINGGDADVKAQAGIWLADALYESSDFKGAEKQYKDVLATGRAGNNLVHLLYNMGYAQLRLNKFDGASSTFSRMLSSSVDIPEDMKRDARLRVADCKYYAGKYKDAKSDFAALRSGGYGADYAIYRYAQILGIEGNLNEKISELRRMETEFSSSKWMPNALNELAETYVATERNAEAAAVYSRMLSRYPSDASSAHARLGMASALMDSGDKEGAVMAYKEILTMQPSSAEARLADKALREYYADRQELREYAQFLRSVPGFSIDAVEMENLSYEAAERNYLADGKLEGVKKYLKDYPGGAHNAEAWLTLGRHYQDAADKQNALAAYRELEKTGGAEYATDAYIGIMRMADNSGVRADYARRLRESGGASADVIEEADFYINEGRLSDKSAAVRTQAERRLRELAANPFSEFGARSAVALGEHLIETGRNKEALELMEEFTSSGSEHNYWVARGFIVIADAYAAMGDKYTSEEYLRSLQRNYPGNEDDIRRACSARLGK